MPLTPEEQAEMQRLQSELAPTRAPKAGLTDAERIEMAKLREDLGQTPALDKQGFMGITPRGVIHGALNVLPTAGMVAGGLVGGAAGTFVAPGAGTIAGESIGSGAGDAAGEALKGLGQKYILGEDPGDIASNAGKGFVEGSASALGGRALFGGAGALAKTQAGQTAIDLLSKAAQKGEAIITSPAVRAILPLLEMQHGGPLKAAATVLGTTPEVLHGVGYVAGKGAQTLNIPSVQAMATKAAIEAGRKFSPWDEAK